MPIPTEPIGSIPRPPALLEAMRDVAAGRISHEQWRFLCDWAIRDTIKIIKEHVKPEQRIFVGVIDPIHPKVETPEQVRDRILEAAEYIHPAQLGTTDDCGFSPFADDVSTARETAFEKIRARVTGTELTAQALGL